MTDTFGGGIGNDTRKVIYYTPVFGGFQAGAWFGHSQLASSPANLADDGVNYESGYSAIINADLGGVGFGLAASHSSSGGRISTNHAGANLSMSGFTIGGGWGNQTIPRARGMAAWGTQGKMWDIGASYATGPYAVSLTYTDAEAEGPVVNNNNKDTREMWVVSGSYAFAPGVDLVGSVISIDVNDEANVAANENNVVGVALGVKLGF